MPTLIAFGPPATSITVSNDMEDVVRKLSETGGFADMILTTGEAVAVRPDLVRFVRAAG